MSSLRQGILGGLAGGFEAYGEVVDDRIEDKREQKKQAALLKRQKTLAKFQSDLTMDRKKKQWGREDELRKERIAREEAKAPSGYELGGKPLTKEEVADLPAHEHKNLRTIGEAEAAAKQTEHKRKKDLATHKAQLKAMVARAEDSGFDKNQYEAIKGEARSGAEALISHYGGTPDGMTEDSSRYFISGDQIPGGITDSVKKAIKRDISSYGFETRVRETEDGLQVDLGSFNRNQLGGKTKKAKLPGDAFERLLDKAKGETDDDSGESNYDDQKVIKPMPKDETVATGPETGNGRSEIEQQVSPENDPGGYGVSIKPEQENKPIGYVDEKPITRTDQGYMVFDEGSWRRPNEDEMRKIQVMAQKGQLGSSGRELQYRKNPNVGIASPMTAQ